MTVEKLEYEGFRNIRELTVIPSPGVNVIYGENAQGKTNLLEGIWMFTGFKSFRAVKDSELVQFGSPFARLKTVYSDERRDNEAEIKITARRNFRLNGVGLKSSREMLGRFGAVIFAPEFMNIVKNGAAERRSFTDTAICRLSPSSAALMTEYERVLKQRNSLIKNSEGRPDPDLLDCLDEELCAAGEKLVRLRKRYLEILTPETEKIYDGISSGREKISLSYVRHGLNESESMLSRLRQNRERDLFSGMTSVGPHRDDIEIMINGTAARTFGSQGQLRSCAIALKLGESEVIAAKTSTQPVVLLDDVMSELDESRQNYILNSISDRQVFITCCDKETVKRLGDGKRFEILNGKVRE